MSAQNRTQSGYVDVNGGRIFYEMAGAGEPLILIHAGIADRRMWDPQFDAFARQYQVIRYDTSGYGRSLPPTGSPGRVEDLEALFSGLGITQANLIGCSQGGTAALDFALAHPQEALKLVLVSAAPSGFPFKGQPPQKLMEFIAAYNNQDVGAAAELGTQVWFDGPRRFPGQMNAALRDQVLQMMRDVMAARSLDLSGEKLSKQAAYGRLDQLAVPAFVIVGDQDDPSVLSAGDYLSANIPRAKLTVLPNAAHLLNMEQPAVFNRLVLEFIQ